MAHFAELDDNNIVIRVIVVHNNELLDESGQESELKGQDFCTAHYGGRWVQTSYNNNFRVRYAGIGMIYDEVKDAFYYPNAPFPSWILNETTFVWEPPIPQPIGVVSNWSEESQSWIIQEKI